MDNYFFLFKLNFLRYSLQFSLLDHHFEFFSINRLGNLKFGLYLHPPSPDGEIGRHASFRD